MIIENKSDKDLRIDLIAKTTTEDNLPPNQAVIKIASKSKIDDKGFILTTPANKIEISILDIIESIVVRFYLRFNPDGLPNYLNKLRRRRVGK